MYVIERFMMGKSNSDFRLKLSYYISGKSYHSENGVYGYKQSQRRYFEGICLIEKSKNNVEFNFFTQVFTWNIFVLLILDIKGRFSVSELVFWNILKMKWLHVFIFGERVQEF